MPAVIASYIDVGRPGADFKLPAFVYAQTTQAFSFRQRPWIQPAVKCVNLVRKPTRQRWIRTCAVSERLAFPRPKKNKNVSPILGSKHRQPAYALGGENVNQLPNPILLLSTIALCGRLASFLFFASGRTTQHNRSAFCRAPGRGCRADFPSVLPNPIATAFPKHESVKEEE